MRERPILFSASMVRAILTGTKTQTRRVVKPQPVENYSVHGAVRETRGWAWPMRDGQCLSCPSDVMLALCPYGQPGDWLWVRESFSGPRYQDKHPPRDWHSTDEIHYWADGCPTCGDWTRTRPGMFMPRWASRITLEVTGVRVERLQDISEADALAEGIGRYDNGTFGLDNPAACMGPTASVAYMRLWEHIHGSGSWDENPWLWAITFERIKQ